ncbi:hypothetical protein ACQW5G_01255 [Fructilactobacillus sp. Tb1]|uniref:hypothetical protein n=1 Tax=Fructilactobacillus sp. Tb1 TaxID=3422304 RepID=UPI003D2AEE3E
MENKYYIFLGQDIDSDDCFINYDEKHDKYFIDSKFEGDFTQTKFNRHQVDLALSDLKNLMIEPEDVVPVGKVDD